MPDPKRDARKLEIEQAAYDLLAEKGYKATSMLEVAKRANASNQTLYKWYGDKNGLFLAMVRRNVDNAQAVLGQALAQHSSLDEAVDELGPALIRLLMSCRVITLNRAAAAGAHDEPTLGLALASGARKSISSLLAKLISQTAPEKDSEFAANLYLDLLIADLQVRRVIGEIREPDEAFITERSARAKTVLWHWLGLDAPQG